jgi:multidrug transporter EmrE-like cation transporter
MRFGSVAIIVASVLLSSGGQIILKRAMTEQAVQRALQAHDVINVLTTVLASPQIIVGLGCFVLSISIWLLVLSSIPLSSAYPFVSLGIFFTTLAGAIYFGESLTPLKALGVGLIMGGVLLVSLAG